MKGERAHQLARRAEAALRPVVRDESALQRLEPVLLGDAFDRLNRASVRPCRELAAGVHGLPVHQDRARAALAAVASDLGAGQSEVIAQQLGKRPAIFHVEPSRRAVQRHADRGSRNCRIGLDECGRSRRRLPVDGGRRRRCDHDCGRRSFEEIAAGKSGRIGRPPSRAHGVTREMREAIAKGAIIYPQ